MHCQHCVETNRFYRLKCLRDSVSRKPLFLPKTGKHDVTMMPFIADVSKLASFAFVRTGKIDGLISTENLVMIRTKLREI